LRVLGPLKGNKLFLYAFISSIVLSILFLLLSLILPSFISSGYYEKNLEHLKTKAKKINGAFNGIMDELDSKQALLFSSPFPQNKDEIFNLFKKLSLNKENEGIGYYDKKGHPILWIGNVIDLETIFENDREENPIVKNESFILIHHKSSVYLASFQKIDDDKYLAFYRLLSFLPQIKTPYLKEYHFLKPKLLKNCNIDYYDYHDEITGFEKFFHKHNDIYIGEARLHDEFQTIFFPLRNRQHSIIATVTLSSPSISSKISTKKEELLLAFYLLLGISFIFLLIYLFKYPVMKKVIKFRISLVVIMILIGLRFLFFPLSQLEKIQSLSVFSPSTSSFLSLWNFTKSPADIFLTALFLFLIVGYVAISSKGFFRGVKRKHSLMLSLFFNSVFILVSLFLIIIFQKTLSSIVFNSNLNLLNFYFNPSFVLLHIAILLFFFCFYLASLMCLRFASFYTSSLNIPLILFFLVFGLYIIFPRGKNTLLLFFLQAVIIFLIIISSYIPGMMRKKGGIFISLFSITLFIYLSLHSFTFDRNHSLVENSLKNKIKSEENWGIFLLKQSLFEIDKKEESILSFLKSSSPLNMAQSLWQKSLISEFNWYSSLEILSPEGETLSRFSLNVPEFYTSDYDFPLSQNWTLFHQNIIIMGKEKQFLIGYKDWFERGNHVGRMILSLSVDYDMLPFLYSANPYFEVLRVNSIPSLNQLDLGLAIFDPDGKLIFNPNKITSGIPLKLLERILSSRDAIWSSFTDKGKKFESLYFKNNNRIYSLFLPQKTVFRYSVEFLKLFFFYLAFFLLFLLFYSAIYYRRKIKNPFWSFSNRVFISFVAIATIPLLLFTFSTRNFFSRVFSQQVTEKAESYAGFARRIMEDFILLEQPEEGTLPMPTDNLVLWISSTISNDVNLYKDGKINSSSRREFFDYGLLPELLNGEIFYEMQYKNNLFFTQTQKIGDYSFHTLTLPFFLNDTLLLISVPFPLEQQEIAKASGELIEFLLFISAFFIAIVLIFAHTLGKMIVTPVKNLLKGTREVSLGNFEISIQHKHEDEMKTLVNGFNEMIESLKKHQQELAEMSKKVAWTELARKVAHEIKNPLTPIQLSAEHLMEVYKNKKGNFEGTLKESTSYIITEVENLRKIAREFLEISKESELQKQSFDLKNIIQETIEPYKKILEDRIVFKEIYEGKNFSFVGDKPKIKIAFRNIIINAIESIRGKGMIELKVSSSRTNLMLVCKDTGIGIEKDKLKKIFNPYFSTKEIGTGLGLSIAKKIIEDHGGIIQASSKKNEGTCIIIKLPKEK